MLIEPKTNGEAELTIALPLVERIITAALESDGTDKYVLTRILREYDPADRETLLAAVGSLRGTIDYLTMVLAGLIITDRIATDRAERSRN